MTHSLNLAEKAILQTILYYDIFDYPLTLEQIYLLNSDEKINKSQIAVLLEKESLKKIITEQDGYYFLKGKEQTVLKRQTDEHTAQLLQKIALQTTKLFRHIPFLKAACISGDLSKGVANKDSDIDFFIITSSRRLYLCKLFLAIFHRLPLYKNHELPCYNYLIAENHLEINEKDIFNATELIHLRPVTGEELFLRFLNANRWVSAFFPHYESVPNCKLCNELSPSLFRRIIEKLMDNKFGDWLNIHLKGLWTLRWHLKYPDDHRRRYLLTRGQRSKVSKTHGNDKGQVILWEFQKRLRRFNISFPNSIHSKRQPQ